MHQTHATLIFLLSSLLWAPYSLCDTTVQTADDNSWKSLVSAASTSTRAAAWSTSFRRFHLLSGITQSEASGDHRAEQEKMSAVKMELWTGIFPPISAGVQFQASSDQQGNPLQVRGATLQWTWFEQFGMPTLAWRTSFKNLLVSQEQVLQSKSYGLVATWGFSIFAATLSSSFHQYRPTTPQLQEKLAEHNSFNSRRGMLFGGSHQMTLHATLVPGEWGVYTSYSKVHTSRHQMTEFGGEYQW